MAEKEMNIRIHHERPAHEHEVKHSHEHHKAAEQTIHKPEQAAHHKQEQLEHARAKATREAKAAHETPVEREDTSHRPKQAFINHELKEMAYQRTIIRVRRQLSPLGRFTSKVVHQPVINSVSEFTGKTVGRPSGLLGGGLVAFVGTSVYFYITKHYGYEYSFTVFLVLLVGGFIIGWLAELFYRALRPKK